MKIPHLKIFSLSSCKTLSTKIAKSLDLELGKIRIERFADSEILVTFEETIRGCAVFIIQSTNSPTDNIMELLLAIDAAKRASAEEIIVVTPYYGYARQDRKEVNRCSIGAKLMADMFTAAGATRTMALDLHAGQIQGFFNIPFDHLRGTDLFQKYIKDNFPVDIMDNLCICSPDAGGIARARALFKKFPLATLAMIDKERKKPNEVASMNIIGDVKGKHVILIDDMIDTGGTICKASDVLLAAGALSVRAMITHPVMSTDKAYENIANSSLIELIVTDSIELKKQINKITVVSCADYFANIIMRIFNRESLDEFHTKHMSV